MKLSEIAKSFEAGTKNTKWFKIVEDFEICLKYFSTSSMEFKVEVFRYGKKNPVLATANTEAQIKKGRKRLIAIFSKLAVVDWKNAKGDDGKQVAFDPEKAIRLFEASQELFDACYILATDRENFAEIEEDPEEVGKS